MPEDLVVPPATPGTDLVGGVVDVVTVDIERGKVAEFVRATGVAAAVHTDAAAAEAAGLADVAATPTHLVVAGETSLKATLGGVEFPVTRNGGELTFYAPGKAIGRGGERVAIVARIDGDRLRGRLPMSDGGEILLEGTRVKRAASGTAPASAASGRAA